MVLRDFERRTTNALETSIVKMGRGRMADAWLDLMGLSGCIATTLMEDGAKAEDFGEWRQWVASWDPLLCDKRWRSIEDVAEYYIRGLNLIRDNTASTDMHLECTDLIAMIGELFGDVEWALNL